jgi:hypothetical protein
MILFHSLKNVCCYGVRLGEWGFVAALNLDHLVVVQSFRHGKVATGRHGCIRYVEYLLFDRLCFNRPRCAAIGHQCAEDYQCGHEVD